MLRFTKSLFATFAFATLLSLATLHAADPAPRPAGPFGQDEAVERAT